MGVNKAGGPPIPAPTSKLCVCKPTKKKTLFIIITTLVLTILSTQIGPVRNFMISPIKGSFKWMHLFGALGTGVCLTTVMCSLRTGRR